MNFRILILASVLSIFAGSGSALAETQDKPAQPPDWESLIGRISYWHSKDLFRNLSVIRRWVLMGRGYCHQADRHLLFNFNGRFLGYINDAATTEGTQAKLNRERQTLYHQGKVKSWIAGHSDSDGYPFALSCDQPFVDLNTAIDRMTGAQPKDRLWGTWDGMSAGTSSHQVSLVKVIHDVYRYRAKQGLYTFPDTVMKDLMGQIVIESGARKRAFSARSARGLMQLRPSVLDDCDVPQSFRLHRMAQIDCALKLIQQNHRNLAPVFKQVFGGLTTQKQDRLYGLLLVQTYQIGVGRMEELLTGPELGKPARFYAAHGKYFSAADIALGMIFHNLGRKDLGFASLYYLTDVQIAAHDLCQRAAMKNDPWCHPATKEIARTGSEYP